MGEELLLSVAGLPPLNLGASGIPNGQGANDHELWTVSLDHPQRLVPAYHS